MGHIIEILCFQWTFVDGCSRQQWHFQGVVGTPVKVILYNMHASGTKKLQGGSSLDFFPYIKMHSS